MAHQHCVGHVSAERPVWDQHKDEGGLLAEFELAVLLPLWYLTRVEEGKLPQL